MTWEIREFRINKKGKEIFRTRSNTELRKKLSELPEKANGVYSIQERYCLTAKNGVLLTDARGEPLWSTWS